MRGVVLQILAAFGTGIGVLGFVVFFGAAILWVRFDKAGLPANEAVAVVPKPVLLTTGASFLVPALLFSLGAIAVLLGINFLLGSWSAFRKYAIRASDHDPAKLRDFWRFSKQALRESVQQTRYRDQATPRTRKTFWTLPRRILRRMRRALWTVPMEFRDKARREDPAKLTAEAEDKRAEAERWRQAAARFRRLREEGVRVTPPEMVLIEQQFLEAAALQQSAINRALTAEKEAIQLEEKARQTTRTASEREEIELLKDEASQAAAEEAIRLREKAQQATRAAAQLPPSNIDELGQVGQRVALSLLVAGVFVGELVFIAGAALHTGVWQAVSLSALAFVSAAISWLIYLRTMRLLLLGLAVFLNVGIFAGAATYARTVHELKVEPAGVLRKSRGPVTGFFVAQTTDWLYLGVDQNPERGAGTRLLAIPSDDVAEFAESALVSPEVAKGVSARLALGLCWRRDKDEAKHQPGGASGTTLACTPEQKRALAARVAILRSLTLRYSSSAHAFEGRLTAPRPACKSNRVVTVFARQRGPDEKLGKVTTKPNGKYKLRHGRRPGRYYSKSPLKLITRLGRCGATRSRSVKLP
ncbi:MAG: hypothetical protein AABM66_11815 [Actinomycetota bacterium]